MRLRFKIAPWILIDTDIEVRSIDVKSDDVCQNESCSVFCLCLCGAGRSVHGGLFGWIHFVHGTVAYVTINPSQRLPSIRFFLIFASRAIQTVDFAASHTSVLVPEAFKSYNCSSYVFI